MGCYICKISLQSTEKNISINFPSIDEKVFLHLDISHIQKVISNLLSNALKFAPGNSVINIQSKQDGDVHQIAIEDSGIGIPYRDIAKLTQPYYQASNNNVGGTGIGLSLIVKLLELHDSTLDIQSELGVGSTFSFRLPSPIESQKTLIKKFTSQFNIESQIIKFVNKDKPVILAVDDSEDILYFIKSSLKSMYNVITLTNGQDALHSLQKITPQLIISDLNMPIMDGIQLIKEIRSIVKYKSIPFLLLTGSSSIETELMSLKAGVDFVLQKPISEPYLLSQVSRILDQKASLTAQVKSTIAEKVLPKTIQDDDLILIQEIEKFIQENLTNNHLKSADIANAMGLGEKTLRNRIKSITGITVKEYLKNYRLEKAKLLIEQGYGTKGEIAIATGFSSLSYFSKTYKEYFKNQ